MPRRGADEKHQRKHGEDRDQRGESHEDGRHSEGGVNNGRKIVEASTTNEFRTCRLIRHYRRDGAMPPQTEVPRTTG